jgi:hypothetical protein
MSEIEIGATYRHFKGGLYRVENIAHDSANITNLVVVYRAMATGLLWVRPLNEFDGRTGDGIQRFEKVVTS